jgi:uncharacterized protein (TIGR00661 family)
MKRVLVAPLDWGLGHATRCIPIIRELQRQGCAVVVAGSGDSLALLQREFPAITFRSIPGYEPRYPREGSMIVTMARQLPRFLRVIAAEHKAIGNIVGQENIDLLISDNRYGCWARKIPSVFVTHQSNVLMPERFGWLRHLVRPMSHYLIGRFDHCWIPDFPGDHSLAGDLIKFGDATRLPRIRYIGPLSRFRPGKPARARFDVVAIFSGPEPQRTLLENKVASQLERSSLTYRIVRGLPRLNTTPAGENVVNFLSSDELQECIESARLVIARSGFSTVMDMASLGKQAVFIPTPGQTEQEYLAQRLAEKNITFFMNQDEFDLQTALEQSKRYSGFRPLQEGPFLQEAISSLLSAVKA